MPGNARRPASAREVAALLSRASHDEALALIERYATDPRTQVQRAIGSTKRRLAKEETERRRVEGMYELQRSFGGNGLVMGVDEVGRGALAGPLTVCAVILPQEPKIWGIDDSKRLSPARRLELAVRIREHALAIGTCHVEATSIDAVGIGVAVRMAMAGAIEDAGVKPDCVLIDGRPLRVHPKERALVRGDSRIAAIAAASIVAKVTRDKMMVNYDVKYAGYHLASCKGYGSAEHIQAIREHGLTPLHRVSFCGKFMDT